MINKAIKRRPFLLLELLIALTLLSVCAFPLIYNPLHRLDKEIAALEKIEMARLAELVLADVKKQLYEHTIDLKKVGTKTKKLQIPSPSNPIILCLGNHKKHKTPCFQTDLFWFKKKEDKEAGSFFGVLQCDIRTTHQKEELLYSSKIFVMRGGTKE